MRDPNGVSRGSGFVAFSTPEEASRALSEMNGKMVVSKPLYVTLAQRKEDRRARLQAQLAQMRPVGMPPSVGPRVPMYPPGGPGIGQQIFYGQGPPAIIPSQPGFGYQQQLVPGMRQVQLLCQISLCQWFSRDNRVSALVEGVQSSNPSSQFQ